MQDFEKTVESQPGSISKTKSTISRKFTEKKLGAAETVFPKDTSGLAVKQLLVSLIDRGLRVENGLLVVTDGSKGLIISGIKQAFPKQCLIQRCQWCYCPLKRFHFRHRFRNILRASLLFVSFGLMLWSYALVLFICRGAHLGNSPHRASLHLSRFHP